MARRNRHGDAILDANDAMRWGLTGVARVLYVIVILALLDALGWPFWVRVLVALAIGVASGAVVSLAHRRLTRTAATRSGAPGPP